MFRAFVTREPWAASVVGLLFGPTAGMLFLGRGKWAVGYIGIMLLLPATPFVAAHFELCSYDPISLAKNLWLVPQIVGAVHCYFVAKHERPYVTKWFSRWYSIILLACVVPLSCSILFRTFFYEPYNIPSASMEPALEQGDYIFVSKQAYKSGRLPQRNDVAIFSVVMNNETQDWVKRIVGLPGDKIHTEDGKIFINEIFVGNGNPGSGAETLQPYQLNENQYFVIGDNQNQSRDSRNGLGYIMLENIVGKPVIVIWNAKTRKFTYRPI